jgi:hypothetical protein
VPVSGTQYLLLLGAAIYAILNNDIGNSVGTLEVVGYRYYQHVGGGGRIDLQVRPGQLSVVSGALRSSLPVHPRDDLELVRVVNALDAAGQAVRGTDSRIFRVVSVTHRVERTDVVAYDGPGVLWDHHLRRARILTYPCVRCWVLEAGAAVVAIFLGNDPSSGVIVGALDGASFAAALGHLHDDRYSPRSATDMLLAGKADTAHPHAALVAWTQFDQAVQDVMLHSLPDTSTIQWDKTTAGLSATVCGVRTLSTAERDALAAVNGILKI